MGKLRLRQTYLEANLSVPDAGMHITDINVVDPIMDLFIKFSATNGATHNVMNNIFDIVTNIELVDGSDVLFSLKPKELLAMNAYHYKESMHWGISDLPNAVQSCEFKLPFGLGRYDPTIAFDPTKFKNPQLRITWDLAEVRATGAEGFVANTGVLDAIATIAERYPVRPSGFLMHKHIHGYMTPTAASRRIEMPVDYTHRTVFLRVDEEQYAAAENPCWDAWQVIDHALYNVDEKKYVPFDWYTEDWLLWLKEFYGMWHQGLDWVTSGNTAQYRHTYLPGNQALALTNKADYSCAPWWSQLTGKKTCVKWSGAGQANTVHCKIDGTLPFSTFAYPFGDPLDMEEWLQVRDIGNIRFELHHPTSADDHLSQIFLTQYRPY